MTPRLPRQKKEAKNLVRFIEAHGGKLGAFRSYRVKPEMPREMSPESDDEPGSASTARDSGESRS